MVPMVLSAYFVALIVGILVVTGTLTWYWGVMLAFGVLAFERFLLRQSHITDGDDNMDVQHDAHLPADQQVPPDVAQDLR